MKIVRSYLLCVCFGMLLLTGCSVGMALHGTPEPNLGVLSSGQDRQVVLLNLGQPYKTLVENGTRVDVFVVERGNAPSAGRAVGHGVMDVLTLGLWEVVGTPIEGFMGEKQTITVTYDEQNKVTKIASGAVEKAF